MITSEQLQSLFIIDAHCHFGSGDRFTGPWDTRADISAYLSRARAARISATALIPALAADYHRGNSEVAARIRSQPSQFCGWFFINPTRDQGRVSELVKPAVNVRGFVGIKVHHYNGPMTREVCECAQRNQIPLLWDVGGDLATAEMVASEYPSLNLIIPHLGSFADDWRAQRACLDVMSRHPNVYTDSSGVRRFDLLEEAVDRFGATRLLFGSDGPWLHPAVELEKTRVLVLSPGDRQLILAGNFLRLIRHTPTYGRLVRKRAQLDNVGWLQG